MRMTELMGKCLNERAALCSLYFIVFCIVTVRFDFFHCIVTGLVFVDVYMFAQRTNATNRFEFWSSKIDLKLFVVVIAFQH